MGEKQPCIVNVRPCLCRCLLAPRLSATRAAAMEWSEGDQWLLTLELPAGAHEFKVVAAAPAKHGGSVEWESGPNRTLQVGRSGVGLLQVGGGLWLQRGGWAWLLQGAAAAGVVVVTSAGLLGEGSSRHSRSGGPCPVHTWLTHHLPCRHPPACRCQQPRLRGAAPSPSFASGGTPFRRRS